MFENCSDLKIIKGMPKYLGNAQEMFKDCYNLKSIKGVPEFLGNREAMFRGCIALLNKYKTDDSDKLVKIWLEQGFL
jgi:hypothetical protein